MENSSSIKYEKKFECPYCNKNLQDLRQYYLQYSVKCLQMADP